MCKVVIIVLRGKGSQGELEPLTAEIAESAEKTWRLTATCGVIRAQAAVLEFPLRSLRTPRLKLLTVGAPIPRQECAKRCAAMAVLRFFFRAQFGKSLADLREIEQWVVSESVLASGRVQKNAFSGAAEGVNGMAVAGCGQHTDESRRALFCGNACEFAQHARVVGFVIRVALRGVRCVILQIAILQIAGGVAGGA